MQAQVGQVSIEPSQARNEPARQQTARAAQHEGCFVIDPAQFGANGAQAIKRLGTDIAQPITGICEFQAAPIFDEQGNAKMLFKHLQLTTDCPVGNVQLLGGLADAVQTGSGFKGAQGVERRKVATHNL